jgi:hypothetical protein
MQVVYEAPPSPFDMVNMADFMGADENDIARFENMEQLRREMEALGVPMPPEPTEAQMAALERLQQENQMGVDEEEDTTPFVEESFVLGGGRSLLGNFGAQPASNGGTAEAVPPSWTGEPLPGETDRPHPEEEKA